VEWKEQHTTQVSKSKLAYFIGLEDQEPHVSTKKSKKTSAAEAEKFAWEKDSEKEKSKEFQVEVPSLQGIDTVEQIQDTPMEAVESESSKVESMEEKDQSDGDSNEASEEQDAQCTFI